MLHLEENSSDVEYLGEGQLVQMIDEHSNNTVVISSESSAPISEPSSHSLSYLLRDSPVPELNHWF